MLHSGRATAVRLWFDGTLCPGSSGRRSTNRLGPDGPAKATGCSRDYHQFDSVAPLAEPKAARLTTTTALID
jgi:hypothetical protein